ncbi:MAG: hypothetical protein IGQ88_07190 [Gloeomargaritaceae cyanobacterium C42_A2020_066]|nr:hypothetical protein [Gloeomargaritaceae cyanobacterium C42_A2020_066]
MEAIYQPLEDRQWECPQLPLGVYREIQAHLESLENVTCQLMEPEPGAFDYTQSQVRGLVMTCPPATAARVNAILDFYNHQYKTR